MGEAKDIIEGRKGVNGKVESDSVIAMLEDALDGIDSALQLKQQDLFNEGIEEKPENHFKLGILKGVDALLRRAKAMLEDYDDFSLEDDEDDDEGELALSPSSYDS